MSARELWQAVDKELAELEGDVTSQLITSGDVSMLQIGQMQGFINAMRAAREKVAECHKKLYGDFG